MQGKLIFDNRRAAVQEGSDETFSFLHLVLQFLEDLLHTSGERRELVAAGEVKEVMGLIKSAYHLVRDVFHSMMKELNFLG